ncbi:MAG: threonine synthase [Bacteroidales bacterium]|nr:threonine synthase [Bacteroidales bacterium]
MSYKYIYRCTDCESEWEPTETRYLCPKCAATNTLGQPAKGVLHVVYDYPAIYRQAGNSGLFSKLESLEFLPLLPIETIESLPPLRVGKTPLYRFKRSLANGESFTLLLKDDSQNPTFSFKDRASALVSAWAKENGIEVIVAASTGNAGSSLAGICASQGQKAVIFVPAKAPIAKLTQIMMYGARIVPVDGNYDLAFDLSIKATELFGWYNRNTAFNPLTIEGKKTVSFEIFSQLKGRLPDRIFVPVGDGVIISGVYKGLWDLMQLGLINRIPAIVAVQAEGSCNLIRNIENEDFISTPSDTIADSISVDIPRNYYMARKYLLENNGEWITVSDQEILDASKKLSAETGIFTEPAAACAYAGLEKYNKASRLAPGSENLVLLTGSGLKDLNAVQQILSLPEPIQPDPEALKNYFLTKN